MNETAIERITKNSCEEAKILVDENARLRNERDEAVMAYNNILLKITSTIPFTGEIGTRNISVLGQLDKMIDAYNSLEKIKKIAVSGAVQEECIACEEIVKIIDGVLGNDI